MILGKKKIVLRSVMDTEGVFFNSGKERLSLYRKIIRLEIDPIKIKDFFKKHELFAGYALLIIALVAGAVFYTKSNANIVNFYPSNCLGGWQNPKHAEGEPDVESNLKTTDFSDKNSAVLDNVSAQIFCRDFKGEIPEGVPPKKFILGFSIIASSQIAPDRSPLPVLDEIKKDIQSMQVLTESDFSVLVPSLDTSSVPTASTTDTKIDDSTGTSIFPSMDQTAPSPPKNQDILVAPDANSAIVPDSAAPVPPESTPVQDVAPTIAPSDNPVSSLFKNLFIGGIVKKVFAQEPTPENPDSPQIPPENIVPPEEENNNNVTTNTLSQDSLESSDSVVQNDPTTTPDTETLELPAEPSLPVPAVDLSLVISTSENSITTNIFSAPTTNDYLEVSYTLDGQIWKSLGKIGRGNMASPFFEIPFENMTWEDINKIQISVSPVYSIDKAPVFYLDGMWIEAEYDAPKLNKSEISVSGVSVVVDDNGNAKIDDKSIKFESALPVGELQFFALPDSCMGDIEQIKKNLMTAPYCGEPIGFPVMRPDDYFWEIDHDMRLVIGACGSREVDCGDHPEYFLIGFISNEILNAGIRNQTMTLTPMISGVSNNIQTELVNTSVLASPVIVPDQEPDQTPTIPKAEIAPESPKVDDLSEETATLDDSTLKPASEELTSEISTEEPISETQKNNDADNQEETATPDIPAEPSAPQESNTNNDNNINADTPITPDEEIQNQQ